MLLLDHSPCRDEKTGSTTCRARGGKTGLGDGERGDGADMSVAREEELSAGRTIFVTSKVSPCFLSDPRYDSSGGL
eukprot:scaffold267282_cov24-Tisochrysis_lutea.AAC.1